MRKGYFVGELGPGRPDGIGFSPVCHDQLLLVQKTFHFDKRPYSVFLSRANTANVGVNSEYKKRRRDENIFTSYCTDKALIIS